MADVVARVKINMPRVLSKVNNDYFRLFLAQEWRKLCDPFVPSSPSATLRQIVEVEPGLITYKMPYAHYMYNGIIYGPNFPIDADGNFVFPYDPSKVVGWKSPKHKYPTGRRFNYSKDPNAQATDHWSDAAEKAGQKDKLIEAANKYLRGHK